MSDAPAAPARDERSVIAVGVSPTSGSRAALRWAADEAERRGSWLLAVSAWRGPRTPISTAGRPPAAAIDPDAELATAGALLEQQVVSAIGSTPHERRVVRGSTFRVLLEVSETADLLVLDAPARVEFPEAPLLAHRLVYAAECPVVVMPPAVTG